MAQFLTDEQGISTQNIYDVTRSISNNLHVNFGVKNLYHRMIFTACALVAQRYGARLESLKDRDFSMLNDQILITIKQNMKSHILEDVYQKIEMKYTENQKAINDFIDDVCTISDCVNSNEWRGEDVMGIFFNEFNRYKKKSEAGQVFTPEHITSFMYRLIGVTQNDYLGDFTCGSGAFLVKGMSNMMREAGGYDTNKAKEIRKGHLFGIEFDKEIYALACANMLIHKDGKTNLEQTDMRTDSACEWIKSKPITKVLMNPPYENKYGCMTIVENVLDSVKAGTDCAFILPDKKLEKASKAQIKRILENHTLTKIIKLPEPLFFGVGVTTSIFVFKTGQPQNGQEIFGCYIEDDGLETVKNEGRQDIKHKWKAIEDYWIDSINKLRDTKHNTAQWINPDEHLSYQMPEKPFEISEEDFKKTAMDYICFKQGIDTKEFGEKLLNAVLYGSEVTSDDTGVNIKIGGGKDD
jgi:type I restriction-modification system DNA methylase subunit